MKFFFLTLLLCGAATARAATIVADSASAADVQAAVHAAVTGDIVEFPASPDTVEWTTNVHIGDKLITLDGKGWTVVDENPSRSSAGTLFFIPTLTVAGSTNSYLCISNLTMQGGAVQTGGSTWGNILIQPRVPWWRLCHLTWELPNGRPGWVVGSPGSGGLIDHNVFHVDQSGWYLRNDITGDNGHLAWSTNYWATNTYGGYEAMGNSIYFENNLITNGVSHRAFIDGDAGMLVVARSNTFWNGSVENHGRESSGKRRSGFWIGSYTNQFLGSIGGENAVLIRGGSGMVAANNTTGAGYPGLLRMTTYQGTGNFMPWGQATGNNDFDLNYPDGPFDTGTRTAGGETNQFVDSSKSWEVNEWVGFTAIRNPAFTNGTGSQSTTTVTATDDVFTAAMAGSYVRFANGAVSLISSVDSASTVTVNSSRTITSQAFKVESLRAGLITSNNATVLVMSATFDGTSLPWVEGDTMAIYRVDRALDQVGCGPGTLLTGGADSPAVSSLPNEWPNQSTNTIYIWGNSGTTTVGGDLLVIEDRDWDTVAPESFDPEVYPHPLVGGEEPIPPSPTRRMTAARASGQKVTVRE